MTSIRQALKLAAALSTFAAISFPGIARAGTIEVTNTNDSGPGSLRAAIEGATPGGTVAVPAGTYTLSSALRIERENLTIDGAGARRTVLKLSAPASAFYVDGNNVAISGLTVTGAQQASAIFLEEGVLTLTAVELTGNLGGPRAADGGGVEDRGSLIVRDSTIANNSAYSGGGIDVGSEASATIEDSTISGNQAGNAEPANNGDGGGIVNSGTLTLINDTIAGNHSFNAGGGLFSLSSVKDSVVAKNTIIAENTNDAGAAGDYNNCSDPVTDPVGPNLESGEECEFSKHGGISDANPLLESLANNGGELQTQALEWGSPAINSGTNEGCPAADERGVARPQLGTCDIGAYEYQAFADLGISQSALPTAATVGDAVTFTLTVSNAGPDVAPGVIVQDTLPAGSTLESTQPSQGSCAGSMPVKCSLGTLASGAHATVRVTAKLGQAGVNTNTASVGSEATDTSEANNQSQLGVAVTAAAAPDLTHVAQSHSAWAEKKLHGPLRRVAVGTRFSFTLNEQASVSLTFAQHRSGRDVRGHCVAPSAKNRRARSCKRSVALGSITLSAKPGANTFAFTGHLGRSTLPAGIYTLTVRAVNAAGKRSASQTLTFTIA